MTSEREQRLFLRVSDFSGHPSYAIRLIPWRAGVTQMRPPMACNMCNVVYLESSDF
jgi:hypothetical protein